MVFGLFSINFTGVQRFRHLNWQHSSTLCGRVFNGQFVIFLWCRSSWQTTWRNFLQESLHWNQSQIVSKHYFHSLDDEIEMNVPFAVCSYLAPCASTPFWTPLLRTIGKANGFLVHTVAIVDYLIGSFADTSHTTSSIATITTGWARRPSIRPPNKSIRTVKYEMNNRKWEYFQNYHCWFGFLLLPWNGCCSRCDSWSRRCRSRSGCRGWGRCWRCINSSCRCRSIRIRWFAAVDINSIAVAVDYMRRIVARILWCLCWILRRRNDFGENFLCKITGFFSSIIDMWMTETVKTNYKANTQLQTINIYVNDYK